MQKQSTGLLISHDENGKPVAVEPPPPTKEEAVNYAEQQKAALLLEAQEAISLWQTELQLGIISDEDKANLITWINYIKEVKAVDTSTAPDITWPTPPAE
nr:tail fiber assembly protein [Escherichia coli]